MLKRVFRRIAAIGPEYDAPGIPTAEAAAEWKTGFEPKPEVDYRWVVNFAKSTVDYYEKASADVDSKAASVVGYLGGGTGLFTLGSIAAVASGNAHYAIILCAMPSVIFATISLAFAIGVRLTGNHGYPKLTSAVKFAEHYGPSEKSSAGNGEVDFIGLWHQAATTTAHTVHRKSLLFDRSLKWFAAAVASLLIPLAAGAIVSYQKTNSPTVVIERAN